MHFDRRFVAVISISLTWALVVSGVFYKLAGGDGRGRARPEAQKQVVIATRPLGVGYTLDRHSVTLRGVPERLYPAGAFSRIEDVLDRSVIGAIQADEALVEARLAIRGSGMGLGPLIPPGMRAISVRVNDVVGVAGFVLPGMRVDVLVTGKPPNRSDSETQTVLQSITVLSAGQTIPADGRSQPITTPVVTLLVTPAQAEALTLANNEGHIQLVLRNSTDQTAVATHGRRLNELYGTPPAVAGAAVAPAVAGPAIAPGVAPENDTPTRVRRAAARLPAQAAGPAAGSPLGNRAAAAAAEPDRMTIFRGAVKKIEVFSKELDTK